MLSFKIKPLFGIYILYVCVRVCVIFRALVFRVKALNISFTYRLSSYFLDSPLVAAKNLLPHLDPVIHGSDRKTKKKVKNI